MAARTILVTGASGVIGHAVAAELRAERVIGLVHSNAPAPDLEEVITCDLAAPRLGLASDTWRDLATRTDAIVHAAALTAWGRPRESYEAINVRGTLRVIELARAAGAPVHYVSTIFVLALDGGGLSPENLVRNYIWSKLECERLLAASGVPYS